ncbi:MAG: ABC transporter permease subunit [Actinobacteria bacterium]|nr:ABC transporter permease subunit [Actinomycetota bacterium]
MSPTVAPKVPPPRAAATAWSLPSRAVAAASGPVGLGLKLFFLALVNAFAVWAAVLLAGEEKWVALAVLVGATLAIDVIYLSPRSFPLKFLIPGTVFLLAFQVVPIVFNTNIAFSNWSTGHILTRSEAIEGIQRNSLAESAEGGAYAMAPARDDDGRLVLVLVDENTSKAFLGTRGGLEELPAGIVRLSADGEITGSPPGVSLVPGDQLLSLDRELAGYTVPVGGERAIRPEGFDTALELAPSLRYDAQAGTFTRIGDGVVYRENNRGSFVAASGEELEPGWRTGVGFANFSSVLNDPLVREPFIRVLVWTFAFAILAVLLSFAFGLFLAIALDKPKLRFQRTYRSLLVIPYAVPGFLSLLVWRGLLNDDFGVVNSVLHLSVPWLFDPTWAKVSIVLVSVWLTFPYFFLVAMGALQSIPGELIEAARVDGGGRWQIFRRVTLPLLLVAVAPLLIASFAFNFNNFGNIYLLTGGGPPANDQSVAGATDILITYTYKIAFESGKGQDYGLASAVSILIFFIVATISAVTFWRSKSLENIA